MFFQVCCNQGYGPAEIFIGDMARSCWSGESQGIAVQDQSLGCISTLNVTVKWQSAWIFYVLMNASAFKQNMFFTPARMPRTRFPGKLIFSRKSNSNYHVSNFSNHFKIGFVVKNIQGQSQPPVKHKKLLVSKSLRENFHFLEWFSMSKLGSCGSRAWPRKICRSFKKKFLQRKLQN